MLSAAYLNAIAASAGFCLSSPQPDRKKVDWRIEPKNVCIPLSIQMKCSYDYVDTPTCFKYDLDVATYDELRQYSPDIPAILAVLFVPRPPIVWVEQTVTQLLIRQCMHWFYLGGKPAIANSATVRIDVPKVNVLSSDWLITFFDTMATGGNVSALL